MNIVTPGLALLYRIIDIQITAGIAAINFCTALIAVTLDTEDLHRLHRVDAAPIGCRAHIWIDR